MGISTTSAPSSSGSMATELAKERNRAAADRTLNSWIRTSLSLIGFGFGISKIHASLEAMGVQRHTDSIGSTLLVGGSFILLGMLALLAAVVQHVRILKRLDHPDFAYIAMRPISVTVAITLLLIGALSFVGILL
jgi:putative membrane protein